MEAAVLHVNTAKTWRGGEQQTLYLALAFQKRNIRQIIVCPPGSPLAERASRAGIEVCELRMGSEADLFAAGALSRIAKKNNLNVLHAHTAKAHSLCLLSKKLFIKNALLIVSRRVDFPYSGNFLSRLKYQSPLVDRYIAISQNVKKILISDGIPEDSIRIAYSGIDPDKHNVDVEEELLELKRRYAIKKDEIVFGNIGALVDHKDQKTLIDALHLLHREGSRAGKFRLFIVGDGELREKLEERAGSQGVFPFIIFTGFQNHITPYLKLFDIFVMSSKEEGLGTSVLDAMSVSLPVIGTRAGGIPEMIDHEKGGILVEPGNPDAMKEAMLAMIKDSSLRKSCGVYNRKKVFDFSYETTAEKTLNIYKELLE